MTTPRDNAPHNLFATDPGDGPLRWDVARCTFRVVSVSCKLVQVNHSLGATRFVLVTMQSPSQSVHRPSVPVACRAT